MLLVRELLSACRDFPKNAHGPNAKRAATAYAKRHRLADAPTLRKLEEDDPGGYAAYVFPKAAPEIVQLCADYFAWLILFDDAIGECRTRLAMGRLHRLLMAWIRGTRTVPGLGADRRFLAAAEELRQRGAALSRHAESFERAFHASIADYMRGCLTEGECRIAARVPTLEEYVGFRHQTIGARPILDILVLSLTLSPSEEPAALRCFRALDVRMHAARIFAWTNDIVSYRACRTETDKKDRLNLITVLRHGCGLDSEEAREAAHQVCQKELGLLSSRLSRSKARPLARAVHAAVQGNAAWYLRSSRYHRT